VLEHKSGNISEKKIGGKLRWRAYRNSPTLFRTVPSSTIRPPFPQYWGSQPHPKLQSPLFQERVKLRTSNYIRTFRIDRNKSLLKISVKVAMGVLRDSRKFWGHHYADAHRAHREVIFAVPNSAFLSAQKLTLFHPKIWGVPVIPLDQIADGSTRAETWN